MLQAHGSDVRLGQHAAITLVLQEPTGVRQHDGCQS